MTTRAQRRSAFEVTLFPFLAVLICTVGALVVLLVVVVQQARASVEQEALAVGEPVDKPVDKQPLEALEQLAQAAEDAQWHVQMLQQTYDAAQQSVADDQAALGHLEDHIQRLKDDMRQLVRREQRRSEVDLDGAELSQLQQQLSEATQQLKTKQTELGEAKRRAALRSPKYSIIPYDGPQGTSRQPIYIECLDGRVLLQPEAIELSPDDFRPPLGPGNPLAAALRAKADFLAQQQQTDQSPAQPYPLLIVRPGGSEAYAACRAAMQGWQAEFGYELIPESMQLDYPAANSQLTDLLQRALADARRRQVALQRAAPSRYGQFAPQRRPARGGGFEPVPQGSGASGPITGAARTYPWSTAATPDDAPPAQHPTDNGHRQDPSAFYDAGTSAAAPGPSTPDPSAATHSDRQGAAAPAGAGTTDGSPDAATAMDNGSPASGDPGRAEGRSGGAAGAGGAAHQPGSVSLQIANSQQGGQRSINSQAVQSSLAETRGSNWALPHVAQGATGIRRPIRIRVRPDALILLAEAGSRDTHRPFPAATDSTTQAVDRLVEAIWQRMETWGIAGSGSYWVPMLVVDMQPGSEELVRQLESLLSDSGLEITRSR